MTACSDASVGSLPSGCSAPKKIGTVTRRPIAATALTTAAGFAALVYASSLWWPPTSVFTEQRYWGSMTFPPDGNRYFFLPTFVLVLSLVWMACSEWVALRVAGIAVLGVVLVMGVRLDWREPPLRDFDWPRYAAAYERAAPGERGWRPRGL